MSYAALARYYDLENADFADDLPFWLSLAEAHGVPILELGCGTGRVLLSLARAGYAVTGLDNSPEMLARLDAKLGAGARAGASVLRADMRSFQIDGAFRLALMPYNTFMHLLTAEDQIAALTSVRRHLQPGAALALDLANAGEVYAAHEQGLTLERTFQDGDRTVQQFSSLSLDRAAQIAHVTWQYDSVAPDGQVQRLIAPMRLRHTFPGEMRLLLERCGFGLTHLYGDYDRSPFAEGAPRMLVVGEAR